MYKEAKEGIKSFKDIKICLVGEPKTKKNSQQIAMRNKKYVKNGRVKTRKVPFIIQSKSYSEYEKDCLFQCGFIVRTLKERGYKLPLKGPLNLKCVYYRSYENDVDITNLMSATHDILVRAGIIEDDNWKVVDSVDGSKVYVGEDNPRVDIDITFKEDSSYLRYLNKKIKEENKKEMANLEKEINRFNLIMQAKKYRDYGWTWKKVADRLDVSSTTASRYYEIYDDINSDDLVVYRKMKERYKYLRDGGE